MSKVIGLTGPLAAGKSEVAKILSRHGAHIIEADELGHRLLVPQSEIWCRLVRAFGSKVLNRGGEVNRRKLGRIVFSDRKMLRTLDRIMHPPLKKAIREEIRKTRSRLVVINAALPDLFSGLVDRTIVVVAPKETRLRRLKKKGLPRTAALRMMGSQMPQSGYLKLAEAVIHNGGSKLKLKRQVEKLLNETV